MTADLRLRSRDKKLLGTALACLLGFAALAGPAIRGETLGVDTSVRDLAHRAQAPAISATMGAVSTLGTATGILPLMALVSLFAWRFGRRHAMAVPVVMLGAGGLQLLTKWAIDRPRPNLAPWGFPSGHVLSLVVLLGLATYLFTISSIERRWRYVGTSACAVTVFSVALSRLYLNAHWLSDVMGGFAVGSAYLLIVISVLESSPGLSRITGRLVATPGPESLGAPRADAGLVPVAVSIDPRISTLTRADD